MGRLPELSLVSACGLLALAFADSAARFDRSWAQPLYWGGLLVLFLPAFLRLASAAPARAERIGLVVVLGMGLYLLKVCHSPVQFTFFDEFSHWRTADDILRTGHLFQPNPLARISPLYPGLQIATSAAARLTGLSVYGAAIVVVGAARLVLLLALFLFFEQVGWSARAAGIATALYMANPNFVYFSAEFMYESFALPLAVLALFALLRWERSQGSDRNGLAVIVVVAIAAVIASHHMTGLALSAALVLWWAVAAIERRRRRAEPSGLGWFAVLAVAGAIGWLWFVGRPAIGYLEAPLSSALHNFTRLIGREEAAKTPFKGGTGQVAPLWEQLVGFASVGLILATLPYALVQAWRLRRFGPVVLVLAAGALLYPGSLALRLTEGGTETSNRASEFLFVAIAFVLAFAVIGALPPSRPGWRFLRQPAALADRLGLRWIAFAAYGAILFVGGITVGWPSYARLPGPYIVGADARSIDREGITAAQWTSQFLGPGHRIFTDRTNRQLMGSYGGQDPQVGVAADLPVALLFVSRSFGSEERAIISYDKLRYLVVDRRLATAPPLIGIYFDRDYGSNTLQESGPLDPAALAKFDAVPDIARVFDSGDIVIYDVGNVSGVP